MKCTYRVRGDALISISGQRVEERPRALYAHVHVRQLALHQLEVADRLAELLALLHVVDGDVQSLLHQADWPGAQHQALIVQAGHQDVHALVQLAQDVAPWHLDVLEDQLAGRRASHAQLVELLGNLEARRLGINEEGGDARLALDWILGLGVDDLDEATLR